MSPVGKYSCREPGKVVDAGHVTDEGKERSSRNALKAGEHAVKFHHLLPPHAAVLAHEDRKLFYDIFDILLKTYRPACPVSANIVREIAYAQWEINRNNAQKTALWNSELLRQSAQPQNVPPELHNLEAMNAATRVLYGPGGIIPKLNSEIQRLSQHIARLEKRLRFLMSNFPAFGPTVETSEDERRCYLEPEKAEEEKRTDADPTQPIENTENQQEEMPIVTTDNSPEVRAFYNFFFPGRELQVVQPDEQAESELKPAA